MPFESNVELNTADHPIETMYRMAEIEMAHYIKNMTELLQIKHGIYAEQKAIDSLLDLMPNDLSDDAKDDFHRSTRVYIFKTPSKDDLVLYFRLNGVSYGKINKLTGISSNTIAAKRFDYIPRYPIWGHWNPMRLEYWNRIKSYFNLFNQPLYHNKN